MMKPKKQDRYYYVITLDAPMWPRKLMDDLSFTRGIWDHLIAVTDVQNSTHAYGDTYYRGRVNITNPPKRNIGGPAGLVATLTSYCTNAVRSRTHEHIDRPTAIA